MTHSDLFGWMLVVTMFVGALYIIWRTNYSEAAKKSDRDTARAVGGFAGELVAGAIREAMYGKGRR